MVAVRLSDELESKLENFATSYEKTKTDVIREALDLYFKIKKEEEKSSYEIGKELFGRYGSKDGNLSQNYKRRLKEKLHEKYSISR